MRFSRRHYAFWLCLTLMILGGCAGSAVDNATDYANLMMESENDYQKKVAEAENDFVSDCRSGKYESRAEAKAAYLNTLEQIEDDYQTRVGRIYEDYENYLTGIDDAEERANFEQVFNMGTGSLKPHRAVNSLTSRATAALRSIIPRKPNADKIMNDLVGHSISDPSPNGYHPEDWKLEIKEGSVSDLVIDKTLSDSRSAYAVAATMRIHEGNHAYDVKMDIHYKLPEDNDWTIDYINATSLLIVVTHEYDNMIEASIEEDGWGGTYGIKLVNKSEITLIVGGDMLAGGEWRRFSTIVKPHESAMAGGLFRGGSVSEYKINFIVRQ